MKRIYLYISLLAYSIQLLHAAPSIEINNDKIIIECDYHDFHYSTFGYPYNADVQFKSSPGRILFTQLKDGGWRITCSYEKWLYNKQGEVFNKRNEAYTLDFPIYNSEISLKTDTLFLTNKSNQTFVLYLDDEYRDEINIYSWAKTDSSKDNEFGIWFEDGKAEERFNKLVKNIARPYTRKSATLDRTIIGLINNPLGITWGDSWRTPFDEFIPVAERFYGRYDSTLNYFNAYSPFTNHYYKQNSIDIRGQKVDVIELNDAWLHHELRENLHDDTKYILSTEYSIFLYTPKSYKKNPEFHKKEECIWNKELALDYLDKINHELDLIGCNMQKVKSKSICKYIGEKNGKIITLNLSKISSGTFFSVSLNIANKTKEWRKYIVWD